MTIKEDKKMEKIFGIDLGTTFSCISVVEEGREEPTVLVNSDGGRTMPSVVYFESDTNVIAGQTAKDNLIVDPDITFDFIKKHMGLDDGFGINYKGEFLGPEAMSAFILKKLAKDATEATGIEVKDVIITHPAYFGIREKEATKTAGELTGLNVVRLIDEPVAAAYAYGCKNADSVGSVILVYDLGGGTFDATLIRIEKDTIRVICTGGDRNLGGYNWDQRLIEYLQDKYVEETGCSEEELADPEFYNVFKCEAEKAKIALSQKESQKVTIKGMQGTLKTEITLDMFNELTSDLCDKTIMLTDEMLEEAKKKAAREGWEYKGFDSILLVGGSTLMRQIKDAVETTYGMKPLVFDPNEAVAKGAALIGEAILNGSYVDPDPNPEPEPIPRPNPYPNPDSEEGETPKIGGGISITTVTSKSFGVKVVADATGTKYEISNIIFKNDTLPANVTKRYATFEDAQEEVFFEFYETEVSDSRVDLEFGRVIGSASLALPNGLPKNSPLEVTITINTNGLLEFTGRDLTSGDACNGTIDMASAMSQRQKKKIGDIVEEVDLE